MVSELFYHIKAALIEKSNDIFVTYEAMLKNIEKIKPERSSDFIGSFVGKYNQNVINIFNKMTQTELKKKTKQELVDLNLDLQKQVQSTNDKLKRKTKQIDCVKALGECYSPKEAAEKIEGTVAQAVLIRNDNTQLRNEINARDEFIKDVLEKYNKVMSVIDAIKEYIEDQQPYYFLSIRKYVKTVKFVYNEIKTLLTKKEDGLGKNDE